MEGSSAINSEAEAKSYYSLVGDIELSFGSLRLGMDVRLRSQSPASQSSNVCNFKTQVEDTQPLKEHHYLAGMNLTGSSSRDSIPQGNNSWVFQDFCNKGSDQVNEQPWDDYTDMCWDNLGVSGGQSLQRGPQYNPGFHQFSPMDQISRRQNLSDSIGNPTRNLIGNVIQNQCAFNQFQVPGNRAFCSNSGSDDGYSFSSHGRISSGSEYLEVYNYESLVSMAKTPEGSIQLQDILLLRDTESTRTILLGVHHKILELMLDDYGKHVFEKLLNACDNSHVNLIMAVLEMEPEIFASAAVHPNGSPSIQRLIRKVKRTPHAISVIRLLCTRFFHVMTHPKGLYVIQHCLKTFNRKENLELYQRVVMYWLELATNEWGCITLNECINSITGELRKQLLNFIADGSDQLVNDPSGNHVVQHVLTLRNVEINCRICERLQGQYKALALRRNGSHVVEKCIRLSQLGMTLAIQEILGDHKAALQLSNDQFGNYVMQTAIKHTKDTDTGLYESLLKALKPYYAELMSNKTSRHVGRLITEEISLQSCQAGTINLAAASWFQTL